MKALRFAGAPRELSDALLVNPYDIEQVAQAIHFALKMPPEERALRMQHLRRIVKEQNIYRWAATLLTELGEIRLESNSSDAALAASAGPAHFRASV